MLMGTQRKWLRGLPTVRLMPVVANERSQNAMLPNTTKPSLQGLAASVAFPPTPVTGGSRPKAVTREGDARRRLMHP